MPSTGPAIVGEHGPESVILPQGSTVIPGYSTGPEPVGSHFMTQMSSAAGDRPIHVQLVVNRKVLAEAVAHANQDYLARK